MSKRFTRPSGSSWDYRRWLPYGLFGVVIGLLLGAGAVLIVIGSGYQSTRAPGSQPTAAGSTPANANGSASPAPVRSVVICVDPGHPSELNSGETVQNGQQEVLVNWNVAAYLVDELKKRGYVVVCTKSDWKEEVTNKRRAEIANECKAAMMIRLHCDTGSGSGCTLYYPDRQGTKDGVKGPSQSVIDASRAAAAAVHQGMAAELAGTLADNGVKGDSATEVGSRQGALTGSIFCQVPVVTVEMAFLSNKTDAAFIGSEAGEKKMASALAAGIAKYVPAGQ